MALEGTTILITGGSGQIGHALTTLLQSTYPSSKIHILDLTPPSPVPPSITYHASSITSLSTVTNIFDSVKPDVVFHTAGLIPSVAERKGLDREEEYLRVNVEGTMILLEEARRVGVRAFVFTSSADVVKGSCWDDLVGVDEEVEIPRVFDSAYSKSKAKAEHLVLTTSTPTFPTTALRTHAVFSATDTNLLPLIISAPRTIHLGPGTNLYDFTYAPSLAQAHILAAENLLSIPSFTSSPSSSLSFGPNPSSAAGQPFFITNAEPVPFRDFVKAVWTVHDGVEPPQGWEIPRWAGISGIWIAERIAWVMGRKVGVGIKGLGDSLAIRWFENGRARRVLGYVPAVGVLEGVRMAVEGFKVLNGKR